MSATIFPPRWAPQHPDRLQLYSIATPNGKKVAIALEELELPYEAHRIHIGKGDQHHDDYVNFVNPNSKIPAIIDPNGPDGEPIRIIESGAILHYLARKTGQLMPTDPRGENEVLQWLMFQMANVGPMFGQFGHFYMFARGNTDEYGQNRYGKEVTRLLGVLDRQLEGQEWIVGEYSIADIATAPWVAGLEFYKGLEFVGYDRFKNVHAWMDRFMDRPAVQRGLKVTPF